MDKKISPEAWSDEQVLAETRGLRVGYGLKRTQRYGTTRDDSTHTESVAEHLFALHYLAIYFLEFEDSEHALDKSRVHDIITFHDFGEIVHGDVPYHLKTKAHEEQEAEDARQIFESLPESLRKVATRNWEEYESHGSAEARFVYALDKVEPLFELFDPVAERSIQRLNFSYKDHFGKKFIATENYPTMRRFVEAISKDMLSRGVFGDQGDSSSN